MKKILIIEDNQANRYLMSFILEKGGHTVTAVNNGLDGVDVADQEEMDLIIMDIQLPDIDGLETTKRIRSSKNNGKIPIIAVTSFAMPGDKQRTLDAGCTGYLEKPINPDTFLTEIEAYL